MSRPIIIFIALLCIPVIHRLYAVINTAQLIQSQPIKHLAIIMDGNRRWAEKRHLAKTAGHKHGTQTVKTLIKFCLKRKIEIVSVYTFSLENFNRSPEEIETIFNLIIDQTDKTLDELKKQGIKLRFVGDLSVAPTKIQKAIKRFEQQTANGTKLLLNVLFCYGGRQEILSAIKHIVQDVKDGKLEQAPTEELFRKYLWTGDIPDPDLIIRTGGLQRLSNFLTYQTTYSELYFTHRLWPEITSEDLGHAVEQYHMRQRNFGH